MSRSSDGWVRHGACRLGCGACCQSLAQGITVRFVPTVSEPAYLQARGIGPARPDGTVTVTGTLVAPCPQLTGALNCGLHATAQKPQWCQDYPTAPEQITALPCSYWFERDGERVGGTASPYPAGRA